MRHPDDPEWKEEPEPTWPPCGIPSEFKERQEQDPLNGAELDPADVQLALHCIWIGFGLLRNVHVRDGKPVLDERVAFLRRVRLRPGRSQHRTRDPQLQSSKLQFVNLIKLIRSIGDGVIAEIRIEDALPTVVHVDARLLPDSWEGPS